MQRLRFSSALAASALVSIALASAACVPVLAKDPIAETKTGKVSGVMEEGVISWKGIPFAAPPVGELRWRAPQPAAAWQGVRAATAYAHDCMQKPFPSDAAPLGTPPAEDCLYLNVWKPAHATGTAKGKLPVVLWVYGGGFVNGGSSPPTYSGRELAEKGVVVVSFNYRLGRFGTFAHPQLSAKDADGGMLGNYGTLDQVAALKWVHDNIAAFGGDPGNVTLMGESAGGFSVHMLLTSPLSQGLFHRAVIMSGGNGDMFGKDDMAQAEKSGQDFAAAQGIAADDPRALAKLRALPAEKVVDGLNLAALFASPRPAFSSPFADGRIAVDMQKAYADGKFNKIPVMVGATSDDIGGADGMMIKGARDVAATLTKAGVPVYAYRFSYVASSLKAKGAGHASDIPFFFDTQAIKYADTTTARDNHVGEMISDAVVAFAKKGDPNGGVLPLWPRYDGAKDEIMDFAADGEARVGRDPLTRKP
ncbi:MULTISPECIES: carboxylesterase/lipase family protein [unclassified Novosphingobium]|uniref:carboxylesterase/lipase family protein n=1 Tax=unclassified Novosphingobium TaxID=2644732 RepID=UPI001357133B|nr:MULTISPECIES: carboxylesterase family protein [unclassified Novosphingobium]